MPQYKKTMIILLLLIIFSIAITSCKPLKEQAKDTDTYFRPFTMNSYKHAKEHGMDMIIYIGSDHCEACQNVTLLLTKAVKKGEIDVSYLDLESAEKDSNLQQFLRDYQINTIPFLIVYAAGKMYFPETPTSQSALQALLRAVSYTK